MSKSDEIEQVGNRMRRLNTSWWAGLFRGRGCIYLCLFVQLPNAEDATRR